MAHPSTPTTMLARPFHSSNKLMCANAIAPPLMPTSPPLVLSRIRDKYRLATEFDIVVTTYATLGSDFGGKKNQHRADSPLGGIKWHRIVFDEGECVSTFDFQNLRPTKRTHEFKRDGFCLTGESPDMTLMGTGQS